MNTVVTRINCVPPSRLHRLHLLAEYRELPRVFFNVRLAQLKGLKPSHIDIPKRYVLGRGHMKFFYDKLTYLVKRQNLIIAEMKRRGYHMNPRFTTPSDLVFGLRRHWQNDWKPPRDAIRLNEETIARKDAEMRGYEENVYTPAMFDEVKRLYERGDYYEDIAIDLRKKFKLARFNKNNVAGMINRLRRWGRLASEKRPTGRRPKVTLSKV